uniref:hypothetical protein n=1 Tax=Candidatus Electronema sp. TaxID=2698783 RepID=UPI004057A6B7
MNRSVKKIALLQGILLCAASASYAHGPSEFIKLDSYYASARGDKMFYTHYDYMVDDKSDASADHWEITPGFSYTIIDGLTFDVHTHFAKFGLGHVVEEQQGNFDSAGPSPFMEAAAFNLMYNVPKNDYLDIAVTLTYEMPYSRAEELLGSEDVVGGTLIFGKTFAKHVTATMNMSVEVEDGDSEFGWGAGVKTPLTADQHGIAAGLEVFDLFDSEDWGILPGVYVPIGGAGNTCLKFGLEFGEDRTEFKTAFYYMF